MPTIKKKDFVNNKSIEVDEFVNSDGAIISGDRNVVSNSEIETGPVDKPFNDTSDYEKGISTTTDRAARYKQNIPWFARGHGQRTMTYETKKIITKAKMEEKIDDLVKKRNGDTEIFSKNYNNNVQKILNIIEDNSFSDEQLDEISKAAIEKKSHKTNNL